MKASYKAENSPLTNNHLQHSPDGSTISSNSNNSSFHRPVRTHEMTGHRNFRGRGGSFRGHISIEKSRINPRFDQGNKKIQEFLVTHWKNFIRDYHIHETALMTGKNGWKRNNSPDVNPSKLSASPMSTSFDSNLSSPIDPANYGHNSAHNSFSYPSNNNNRNSNKRSTPNNNNNNSNLNNSSSPSPNNSSDNHGGSSLSNTVAINKTSPLPNNNSSHNNSPAHWNNNSNGNSTNNGFSKKSFNSNASNGGSYGNSSWEKNNHHHGTTKRNLHHQTSPHQNNKILAYSPSNNNSPNHHKTNSPGNGKKEQTMNSSSNISTSPSKTPEMTSSQQQAISKTPTLSNELNLVLSPSKSQPSPTNVLAPATSTTTGQIIKETKKSDVINCGGAITRTIREETRHSESCMTNSSQCNVINGSMQSMALTPAATSSTSTTSNSTNDHQQTSTIGQTTTTLVTNKTRHPSTSSNSLTALSSGGASIDRGDTPNTIEQYYTPEPPSSPSTNLGNQAHPSSE